MNKDKIKIVLDTETTGLNKDRDRIIEIGCVKLKEFKLIDKFHQYINPECSIPEEATKIHGITDEDVADKPKFSDIAQEFLDFIGNHNLVAHNGFFDLGFLNKELERAGYPLINNDRMIDSLSLARQKFPNQRNRLDDLCERFNIDTSKRVFHGALLDAELLSLVYLELSDEKQKIFDLSNYAKFDKREYYQLLEYFEQHNQIFLSEQQIEDHKTFVESNLGKDSLWWRYYND